MSRPELQGRAGRLDPFGHHLHAREDFREGATFSQLEANLTVPAEPAGARQDEVAQPAQSGERVPSTTHGARQPRDLGEPARGHGCQRVVPQIERLHDTDGNRDDVLERAANLDARDIVAGVQTEVMRPEVLLHRVHRPRIVTRHQHRRQALASQLHRETRARQHRDRAGVSQLLLDDLRHPQQGSDLETFDGAHECGLHRHERRQRPDDVTEPMGGHRGNHVVRSVERRFERPSQAHRLGERHVRQIGRIRPTGDHVGHQVLIASPQPHAVSEAPEVDGQSRSPGSGPEHGHALHRRYGNQPNGSAQLRTSRGGESERQTVMCLDRAAARYPSAAVRDWTDDGRR